LIVILDPPPGSVTWIKVERPSFDLVGVVVSSLTLAGVLALVALGLGCLAGLAIIRYRRRHPADGAALDLGLVDAHLREARTRTL
jgi:ABC-type spermidine/putrescine transport system permease subunit II